MKTKYFFLFLSMMMPFVTMAQDDDDLYFVPSKKKVQTVQVITEARPVEDPYYVSEETDAAYTRDVDEYNRRGRYRKTSTTEGSGQTVDTLATVYSAGYAQGYGDAYSKGYTDGTYDAPIYRVRFTNIYDPFWWTDPWYYDPWYVSPWAYSWGGYYGWGYRPWYAPRPYYPPYHPVPHPCPHPCPHPGGYWRGDIYPTGRYVGQGNRYVRGGVTGTDPSRNYGGRRIGDIGGRRYEGNNGRSGGNNGRSVNVPNNNRSGGRSYTPSNGRSYTPSNGSSTRSMPSGSMGGSRIGGGYSGGGGRSMGGSRGGGFGGGRSMGRGR